MKLTQVEAARLMAAHEKAGKYRETMVIAAMNTKVEAERYDKVYAAWEAAEQRFAELVAGLTDSEGL
jgi:hypothetical protein